MDICRQLRHRVDDVRNQAYSARCRLLCEKLLDLNIPGFGDEIAYQHDFLEMLDRLSQDVKSSPESIAVGRPMKISMLLKVSLR